MSFYSDASLVFIPSGYKASKAYSAKPTDGTGDLTFTRSNDTATRVASDGLIERVRTNLLLQSQAFDTAAWTLVTSGTGITPIVTANNATAPDGTMTADTIVFNAGAGTTASDISTINQSATIGSQTYSGSFYARVASGTGQLVFRHAGGGQYTTANLTTTWQRFSSSETGTSALEIGIRRGLANEPINASVTVEMWGAQLETGDIATDYIATTTAAVSVGPLANVPRLDYLGSSCPRLLLEPQRTNLALYSEQLDNAWWTATYATITSNATTSPDGYASADSFIPTADNVGNHRVYRGASANLQTATYSIFIKPNGHNYFGIRESITSGASIGFNLATQSVIVTHSAGGCTASNGKIEAFANGWYRISGTFSFASATGQNFGLYAAPSTWTSGDVEAAVWTPNGTSGAWIWGAQVEEGAYATSYIPTLGAAVTRGADECTQADVSSLLGSGVGTAFIDFELDGPDSQGNIPLTIASATNLANLVYLWVKTNRQIVFETYQGNVSQCAISTSTDYANYGSRYKIAVVWANNDFAMYINGTFIGADTNGTAPTPTKLWLGQYFGADYKGAKINQTLLFPTRLSNSDLAALTA